MAGQDASGFGHFVQVTPDIRFRYLRTRRRTRAIVERLSLEDRVPRALPCCSPINWHLGHVSWFTHRTLLAPFETDAAPFPDEYDRLFNTHDDLAGPGIPKRYRGHATRPSGAAIDALGQEIDDRVARLLDGPEGQRTNVVAAALLCIAYEEQHQELMLCDIKALLHQQPGLPPYAACAESTESPASEAGTSLPPASSTTEAGSPADQDAWTWHDGGLAWIGHDGGAYALDHQRPRHEVLLQPFEIASRLVTNREYLAFMDDAGYDRRELWTGDPPQYRERTRHDPSYRRPRYWVETDGEWHEYTLHGLRPLDPEAPVVHVSWYEADAFARWADARLPTEFEWEHAAIELEKADDRLDADGGFGRLHPRPTGDDWFGSAWQWTASAFVPYPGYKAPQNVEDTFTSRALMMGRQVLRGSSVATTPGHAGRPYRHHLAPDHRWQFTGIRLARHG